MPYFKIWGVLTALFLASPILSADEPASSWPFNDVAVESSQLLDTGWRFKSDKSKEEDVGIEESWFSSDFDRSDWDAADVPGVWGKAEGERVRTADKKVGWYAIEVSLPETSDAEPAVVFLGSMFITDVWFNGDYLGGNHGGYTPFMFCLNEHLEPGGNGELVLRIDNQVGQQAVPKNNTGWEIYGGLTREVFLITRPSRRVENLRTNTTLNDNDAALAVSADIANYQENDYEGKLNISLVKNNTVAAESSLDLTLAGGEIEDFAVELIVENPRLWSPADPHLYTLNIAWEGHEDDPQISLPIGLREIEIDGPHFYLNGERLWLQGFGQHELIPYRGPVIEPGHHESELQRIRDFGANHFRTGHYPQHPDLYAAADKIGLLVFTEIPIWQLNRSWIQTDRAWEEWARPQLADMIDWYRNFTSVVSWGAANEMGGTPDYNRRALDFIENRDPYRLPMIVLASDRDMSVYELLPMAGRNLHYGWYHSRRVYGLRKGLEKNLHKAREVDIPIWVAELGAIANPGRFSGGYNDESRRSETYLDKVVRFGFQYCAVTSERVSGVAIWTWSDFIRGGNVNAHGIMSLEREPKLVAYTIRNLYEGDIRIYLTEEETTLEPGETFQADAFVFNPHLQQIPDGFTVNWKILKGAEQMAAGELTSPPGEDRAIKAGDIQWDIPDNQEGMFSLWAELIDDDGRLIHTNSVHFGAGEPAEIPGVLAVNAFDDAQNPVHAHAEFQGLQLPVYEDPGLIIPLPEGEYELTIRYGELTREITVNIKSGEKTQKNTSF